MSPIASHQCLIIGSLTGSLPHRRRWRPPAPLGLEPLVQRVRTVPVPACAASPVTAPLLIPSRIVATISRCTSLTPPPKVLICAALFIRSSSPSPNAPGEPARTSAASPDHLLAHSVHLDGRSRFPANFTPLASPGASGPGAHVPHQTPVEQACCRQPGMRLGQPGPHPRLVDPAAPRHRIGRTGVGERRRVEVLGLHPDRGEGDPLVVELVGDQLPAAVLLADEVRRPGRGSPS